MRIGRIGYINCAPVYGAIDRGVVALPHGGELVTGTPAELNDLLVAGELDVSVISAIEYARHAKDLLLLPDLAISCDGPVRSVALFAKHPVRELSNRTVLLSASSRTSVALLELLCRDVWKIRPKFAEARAEAQDLDALAALPHEAVLVIGDAALALAARGTYPHRYDLGEEWKRWTQQPFVFAVWAATRVASPAAVQRGHRALLASRTWGLAHLDDLAAEASRKTGVAVGTCREYLGGLDYAFSDRHRTALADFLRRVGALQFVQVA
ncbi:MAG TPA: menaquinone biosynthesis protein [Gemmatimonadales bacterium]|nr:menaquinone biosynthesis protein [Gemmatimonadales bacterium]